MAGDLLRVVENSVWAERGLSDMSVGVAIRNVMQGTDGLEVYFISGNGDNGGHTGSHQRTGIVVLNEVSARTLAHEIGHACGLHDIFNDRDCFADDMRESWMPSDWNNGTGHGFYDSFHSQRLLIARLLMYGITSSDKADVTAGSVYGRDGTGVCSNVLVGRSGMLFYPPISR